MYSFIPRYESVEGCCVLKSIDVESGDLVCRTKRSYSSGMNSYDDISYDLEKNGKKKTYKWIFQTRESLYEFILDCLDDEESFIDENIRHWKDNVKASSLKGEDLKQISLEYLIKLKRKFKFKYFLCSIFSCSDETTYYKNSYYERCDHYRNRSKYYQRSY